MSGFVTNVLALLLTLGILIAFHEFGHFWTARKLGVKVLRFSVGFGKPLWMRKSGPDQTEYVLAAFPLGGYVKMLDEREGEVAEEELHRAFNRKSVWRRFAIVAAGPIFNFIFAILAFWLMYLIGVPGTAPIIGEVTPKSVAAMAGFKTGDRIIEIDGRKTPTWSVARFNLLDASLTTDEVNFQVQAESGQSHLLKISVADISSEIKQKRLLAHLGIAPFRPALPAVMGKLTSGDPADTAGFISGDLILQVNNQTINDWMDMVEIVRANPGQTLQVGIERDGQAQIITVTPAIKETDAGNIGRIGAAPAAPKQLPEELLAREEYPVFESLTVAMAKTWQLSVLTLRMIGKMIVGEVSVKNLSGPITIATYAGYTANIGLTAFLYFLAIVSISLGVLNLLPVPLLDGGHLMYYLVEIVKGSPVSDVLQLKMQQVGIAFLLVLMCLALYNDVVRLMGG